MRADQDSQHPDNTTRFNPNLDEDELGDFLVAVGPGDSIGESAVISTSIQKRGASVVAFTPVLALKVNKAPFIEIFGDGGIYPAHSVLWSRELPKLLCKVVEWAYLRVLACV